MILSLSVVSILKTSNGSGSKWASLVFLSFIILISAMVTSSNNASAQTLSSSTTTSISSTGIVIPLYSDPSTTWDGVVQDKLAHPSVPIVAIINPSNGPGTSKDTNYVSGIQKLQSAGIIVLGYVPTSYGNRSTSLVEDDINSYKNWYNVNGIKFDQMSTNATLVNYYSNLTNYTKSLGMTLTVGNPGRDTIPGYIGTVDFLSIYEGSGLPSIAFLGGWHTGYPKSNFAIVAFGVSSLNSSNIAKVSNYVGHIYITDDVLPNPYDTIPAYFGNLLAYLDPSAPQNLQAAGGNARVSLSWQAPLSNGGSGITGYKIYKSTSSGAEVYLTTRGNVASYTDLAVTNGITYFYQVSAINSTSESPKSNEASAIPPALPTAPQNLQAAGGITRVSLSWQAPSSNGGSGITYYKIFKSTSSGTEVYLTTRGNVTSYNELVVTNGTTYYYKVSALNSAGESSQSNEASATPLGPPFAPQNLQPTGGNARVSLSWQAPLSNGGSSITYYKIYKSTSSGTEAYLSTRGNVTSYTDLAVTNGLTYFYKVSALNSIGESPQSNEASVALSAVPSAPQNLHARGGIGNVTLTWQAPSSNGGSAITGYKIYRSTSSGIETYLTTRGNVTSYIDLGVTNGVTYFYKVSALNSIGESLQSNEASATAPTNLVATAGNGRIALSWHTASNYGGLPVTYYKIYKSTSPGAEVYLTTRGNVTSYTDLAVTNGITYFYQVSSLNPVGESALSDESSTVQAGSPTGLTASVISSSQINLRWTAPTNTGGSAIIGYQIQRNGTVLVNNTASTQTSFNDTGLVKNHQQTYRVAAWNSAALGHFSTSGSAFNGISVATIYKIVSGLVATDSLTTGNMSDWVLYGSAIPQNAPHSASEDANGMHIGILAPYAGHWAGYFALSPLTTAHLFHTRVSLPDNKPTSASNQVDDILYVQQEMFQNPHIDAIGCGATLYFDRVEWKTVWQQGNDKAVTFVQNVYDNASAGQPTSRDCTLVTDCNSVLKSYIDGKQVFSSSSMNLNMPMPFQTYLEMQTNSVSPSTGNNFTGTFTDYYATASDSIKVINAGAGSLVKVVDSASGNTLASSTADANGTVFVDVGKYNMPINATVIVYDSTGVNILASTSAPAGIFGGDVYNVGSSTAPQTTITVNGFDSTTNAPLVGMYTTIVRGMTDVFNGFIPLSYTGAKDTEYTITTQNFGTHIFDHWDNGSTYRARIISPATSPVSLTAYYIDGHPTSTSIMPDSPTVQASQQVTFNATVTDKSNSPTTPVGNVTFNDGGVGGSFSSSICTLDVTGSCTTRYTVPPKSSNFPITVTGKYSPAISDTTHLGSYGTSSVTVDPPSILLNPTAAYAGSTVNISGSGFESNSGITLSFDGVSVAPTAPITCDRNGLFTGSFKVPVSSAGSHTVRAHDALSNSASAQFTETVIPSAPQNLQATGSNTRVSLSWQAPSNNGGSVLNYYKIYKSTSSCTDGYLTTRGNVTSYTDLAVTNGVTYFYKVSAVNSIGTSPLSNEAIATPPASPSAPQNLQATGGSARVSLSWQAPSSNGGSAITGYKIFKSTSTGTEVYLTTRGKVTTYTDLGGTNGNTYFYKVSALNGIGEFPQSNEASAVPS